MSSGWSHGRASGGKRGRGRGYPGKYASRINDDAFVNRTRTPSAAARLQETRLQHAEASKRALETYATRDQYESSSEEEDLDEEKILSSLMRDYKGTADLADNANDQYSHYSTQYVQESCQSGAVTCLICISNVKRQEAVWNCCGCYAIFHLMCIQKWVREGIARSSILSEEHFPNKEQPWFCPKCRQKYKQTEFPNRYVCYCGQVVDPPFDPWLIPHSCGNTCEKMLKPRCGHKCLLLCHPGPCPPCPKTVKVSCYCGKMAPTVRRCGAGSWSCDQTCSMLLSCGKHKCKEKCHEGACTPCTYTSWQHCVCGKNEKKRSCLTPRWSCGNECGKMYPCGIHTCEEVCHSGDCGECKRSGWRTCPCGKTGTDELDCTRDVPTCNDTCGKSLGCDGGHKCTRRCHFGECGPCPLMIEKKCRCGKRKKETPCYKEYTCDVKCQKIRDCGNHQCKRKCCDGRCPSCEQICGRSLQCKRHKCQSLCHQGPCYPCILTSQITCKCGGTRITVVCGKEKTTKPPRCKKLCQVPSSCHHPNRKPHYCHFGKCPRCTQVCGIVLECNHSCPSGCHDEVQVKNEIKAAGPWELPRQSEIVTKRLPCPACKFPVPVECLGEHETADLPCSEARPYSCGRSCGRKLDCGNHACALQCHAVVAAPGGLLAGENCIRCERPCVVPRPDGCVHECPSPCHSDRCPPCKKRLRKRCHCGMVVQHHVCSGWSEASACDRLKMQCCGNNCPKVMTCGHLCTMLCHPGDCAGPESCNKKMHIRCPCRRKKKDFLCVEVQNGATLDCDDKCHKIKADHKAKEEDKSKALREEEERKQRLELEKFDRKMQKTSKSRRRRRSVNTEEAERVAFYQTKSFKTMLFFLATVILLVFGHYLVQI